MDNKKKIKIVAGVIAVLVFGILYLSFNQKETAKKIVTEPFSDSDMVSGESTELSANPQTTVVAQEVYIHICGEVKRPGVYCFGKEPRVMEVVKKAGGFTKKADEDAINLAQVITDGTQLAIPSKTKGKNNKEKITKEDGKSERLNINTASKEELMTLSGIGESKATQILSYREENGNFQKIEDIMKISGIKEGVFNKIKNDITV